MIKLLIVDDETLVQIGMQSLVDYEALGIEVVGVAENGQEALEMIQRLRPEIVITDIKMPIMDGLELIARCNEDMQRPPQFIVLTSFDDFAYVRQALRSNVVDYLIKLELNAELLTEALQKTIASLPAAQPVDEPVGDMFRDRFLNQLLHYIFTGRDTVLRKAGEYGVDLSADRYAAAAIELDFSVFEERGHRENYSVYTAVMNMAEVTLTQHIRGYVVAYSETVVGLVLCLDERTDAQSACKGALEHIASLSRKYFSIPLRMAVGTLVRDPSMLPRSFASACRRLYEVPTGQVVFRQEDEIAPPWNLQEINQGVLKALDAFDAALFAQLLDGIRVTLMGGAVTLEEGIDCLSSVAHQILTNPDYGYQLLEGIFSGQHRSHHAVYHCRSHAELLAYLEVLERGVTEYIAQQKQSPKQNLVRSAQSYIRQHLYERITLNDVAQHIDVSPNYLSATFKKYAGCGFNDYVTMQKMRLASQLLKEGNLKVYQVSEMLGFDSSYYFSTVYKKYTGMSPTETIQISR